MINNVLRPIVPERVCLPTIKTHDFFRKGDIQRDQVYFSLSKPKAIQFVSFQGDKSLSDIPEKGIKCPPRTEPLTFIHKNSLKGIEKADVLYLMAHPDDEIFFANIVDLVEKGYTVQTVYAATGNKGHYRNGAPGHGPKLAAHREKELLQALETLNVNRNPIMLDFSDLELYKNGNPKEIKAFFKDIIDQVEPMYVFSFGPEGITDNPDHKKIGELAFQVVEAFNTQAGHKDAVLFQAGFSAKNFALYKKAMANSCSDAWDYLKKLPEKLPLMTVDLSRFAEQIQKSASCHRSQWTDGELAGFLDFYKNAPAEFTSITEFPPQENLVCPWDKNR